LGYKKETRVHLTSLVRKQIVTLTWGRESSISTSTFHISWRHYNDFTMSEIAIRHAMCGILLCGITSQAIIQSRYHRRERKDSRQLSQQLERLRIGAEKLNMRLDSAEHEVELHEVRSNIQRKREEAWGRRSWIWARPESCKDDAWAREILRLKKDIMMLREKQLRKDMETKRRTLVEAERDLAVGVMAQLPPVLQ